MTKEYDINALVGKDGPVSLQELEIRRLMDVCASQEQRIANIQTSTNDAMERIYERQLRVAERAIEYWMGRWSSSRKWIIGLYLLAVCEAIVWLGVLLCR